MTASPGPFRWRSARDWTDLVRAQLAIARARASVLFDPRGEVAARALEAEHASADPSDEPAVRRLALAVDRAARRGPIRANCLVRALALRSLLHRAGIRGARVHIGVRREANGLGAHAWVSFGALIIDDLAPRGPSFAELHLPSGAGDA